MPDETPRLVPNITVTTPSPRKRKKLPWLIAGGVVAVFVIGAAVILQLQRKDTGADQDSAKIVAYNRPGFDRKNMAGNIGDPTALELKASDKPITFQSTKVVQACNILSQADLAAQNLKLEPGADAGGSTQGVAGAITRQFIDGQSQETLPLSVYLYDGQTDNLNTCQYQLYTNEVSSLSGLSVAVYQPFDTTSDQVNVLLQKYTKSSPIDGLSIYARKPDSSFKSEAYVVSNGKGVSVHFELENDAVKLSADKKSALVKTIADNLQKQIANPTGIAMPTYNSPTFRESFVRACNIFTADDTRSITQRPTSPFVGEALPTSTGIVYFDSPTDIHNFVETSCDRSTNDPRANIDGGPSQKKISVVATAYRDEAAAKSWMGIVKNDTESYKIETLSQQIGDESISKFDKLNKQNNIMFRKGRIIINLDGYDFPAQQLLPVAQSIASRVKG